jgi:Flp pilus assembly pilin Flp
MLRVAKLCVERWDGTVAIEYALIAGFIALAIVSALTALGTTLNATYFSAIAGALVAAAP